MSLRDRDLPSIAKRHGVNILECVPGNAEERLRLLCETLKKTDVPYPINPGVGARYLADATAKKPFGVGNLADETVDLGEYHNYQNYDGYSAEEHLSWACLVADQQKTKTRYACREYLVGEQAFEIGGSTIPDYYQLNARIYQQTGWQLATVNKIIPAELFFTCHSKRFFPVTTFMRELELDYLEEPDIGHDIAGHVATFTIPAVAHVMQNHGIARDLIYAERDEKLNGARDESKAASIREWADELLLYAGRIYWFTVEFGLVMQDGEVRDFGAGILSSPGETVYSIDSIQPNRILINPSNENDLLRLATTDYLISEFQKTYFVMESFSLLESLTPSSIVAAAKMAQRLPHFTWREIVPGDRVLNVGRVVTSTNEKYFRLMAGLPLDECLTRAAIRNLRLALQCPNAIKACEHAFSVLPPEIPSAVVEWFRSSDASGQFQQEILPLMIS